MLKNLLDKFSYDIGIDLGTANILIAVRDKDILINSPSVIAYNSKNGEILATGEAAKRMVGKTPANIIAIRPLKDGVISDLEGAQKLLTFFIKELNDGQKISFFTRPRSIIGVPSEITEVEKIAVVKAAKNAGIRDVYIIEEPLAGALGINVNVFAAEANMVIIIGGGTTEIAIIALGGIIDSTSLKMGGDKMDNAIIEYVKQRFNVLIGEKAAEQAKIEIGNVDPKAMETSEKKEILEVNGRNLKTGLPEIVRLSTLDMQLALREPVNEIVEATRILLENAAPDISSDILKNGIHLLGGGSKLKGLAQLISSKTNVKIHTPQSPELAVVKGTIKAHEKILELHLQSE